MILKRLLAIKGFHYLATRLGWRGLRSAAFDEKYKSGDWNFEADAPGELPVVIKRYLQNGNLLIMGCGSASIISSIPESDFTKILGIDLSSEAIRLASRYSSEKVSFQIADFEDFSTIDVYDIILFSESLNYVPLARQKTFLIQLAKYLKNDGVFVVTFAQTARYADILNNIRKWFSVIEDRNFLNSSRHLIVFTTYKDDKK